jgi:hypothetical protein
VNADRSPRGRKFKARNNAHFSIVLFVSSEANAGDVESTALRVSGVDRKLKITSSASDDRLGGGGRSATRIMLSMVWRRIFDLLC